MITIQVTIEDNLKSDIQIIGETNNIINCIAVANLELAKLKLLSNMKL